MAGRNNIRYVRYYTTGTAVPKIDHQQEQKRLPKGPAKPAKRIPIPFDPLAAFGATVAVLLVVCMFVGLFQLSTVNSQVQEMEVYISTLKAENETLRAEYRHGYDLEEIRTAATAMGMVPVQEVQHIQVQVEQPVQEEEPTWWEQLVLDFQALFA